MTVRIKRKRFILRVLVLLLIFGLLVVGVSYWQREREGLMTEEYNPDFHSVPKLFHDGTINENPKFIVCGDSQPGWRVKEKFLRRENWLTWKMLMVPFYQVYLLGNGTIGGINYIGNRPDYGVRERRIVRNAIYTEARQSGPDFILHMGDMNADGRRPSDWAMFLKEYKEDTPLVSDFPFLPVIGNHEKANDLAHGFPNYEAVFKHPRFYVLDFPDVAIFVVDSNIILDQSEFIDDDKQEALFQEWFVSAEGSQQVSWLERELSSRNQRFKIVAMHHPPICFGRHHTDWIEHSWGRDLSQKRRQLLKLLREQGVQLVLSGHEHIYEHSIVRGTSHENGDESGIHIFISSSGASLRRKSNARKVEKFLQNYHAEGIDVVLVKQEEIHHYCLVDIASDKIIVHVMEVTGDPKQPVRLADEILIPG